LGFWEKEGRKRENIAFAREAIIRRKEIIEREMATGKKDDALLEEGR